MKKALALALLLLVAAGTAAAAGPAWRVVPSPNAGTGDQALAGSPPSPRRTPGRSAATSTP